ncbi:DUF3489 domain-containing protein [Pseudorhodobacter sp. W20_MBD10_FR17]|uniref:DUF3489 domain-containing protein n=1 Tax=Pseudorhodobacter sp. W20_MBD10_FR17 TaxID=3240266 RepID=UPI003F976152
MIRLTDTQSLILTAASPRPGNLAMPLPKGLHGAAAKKVVTLMIERRLIEEVEADLRQNEPLWRETGDGHGTTLIATEAGLAAIGIEPVVAKAMAGLRKPMPEADAAPFSPRKGTKQAELIALLQAPDGVSIADISAVTGWQTHSVRGAISGQLKKKLGLAVISKRLEGRGRVYRIGAPDEWPSAGVGRRSRKS